MKSISKIYFIISFIVLFVLLGSIVFFKEETKNDNLEEVRNYVIEDFNEALEFEKANLLSFAFALSEDGALKKTLLDNDSAFGYILLDNIADRFSKNTHLKKLRLQILDINFQIFAQNWKNDSTGLPISDFRPDLKKFQSNPKPKVGIETGRRLTFKATTPIVSGKKVIGYLEVIKFVDDFSEKLRKEGIEVFVLMDEKHIRHENTLMDKFPRFQNYVIANENYHSKLLSFVKKLPWKELEAINYYYNQGMLFILKPMLNGDKQKNGQFLMVLNSKILQKYQKSHQDISLLTRFSNSDIHNFVKRGENLAGVYENVHDRNMIELLPKLLEEDRVHLKKIVRTRLEDYSKSELIDIILEKNYRKKKTGVVQ